MPCCAAAQEQDHALDGFGIEANVIAGKLFKHTTKFAGPIPRLSTAVGVTLMQQTDGRRDWEQRRKYPLWGVGVAYTDYGIDSVYGKCIGVYPMLQLPIIRSKKVEWTLQFGLGLGYVTRHYSHSHPEDTLNNAISSHINNFTLFATDLRYHVDKHWDLQVGGSFSHISNATFRQPNLGVNMYGAHIGVRYFPGTSAPEKALRKLTPLSNRWLIRRAWALP